MGAKTIALKVLSQYLKVAQVQNRRHFQPEVHLSQALELATSEDTKILSIR
jgi:hypothetical protein